MSQGSARAEGHGEQGQARPDWGGWSLRPLCGRSTSRGGLVVGGDPSVSNMVVELDEESSFPTAFPPA